MPTRKTKTALSHMIDPLSDDEVMSAVDTTMDTGIENLDPVPSSRTKASIKSKPSKAAGAKMAVSKITKAKSASRRVSGVGAVSNARKTTSKRTALAERNAPNETDTDEVDEFDETEVPVK